MLHVEALSLRTSAKQPGAVFGHLPALSFWGTGKQTQLDENVNKDNENGSITEVINPISKMGYPIAPKGQRGKQVSHIIPNPSLAEEGQVTMILENP